MGVNEMVGQKDRKSKEMSWRW